jgi:hypothetical protein
VECRLLLRSRLPWDRVPEMRALRAAAARVSTETTSAAAGYDWGVGLGTPGRELTPAEEDWRHERYIDF